MSGTATKAFAMGCHFDHFFIAWRKVKTAEKVQRANGKNKNINIYIYIYIRLQRNQNDAVFK